MAKPITSEEELIKSALVSVENKEIAELLGATQWELGKDGVIIAEEGNEPKSSIEKVKGIRLDNGFGTSLVITNPEKQSLELKEVNVLMTNYTIGDPELKILNESVFKQLITQKKLGVVLIARGFTSEAIKTCMESLKSGFAIFPVNAPYVDQTQIMKDMEAVIGGRYIDQEEGRLEDIYISDVGFAKRFMARRFDAIIAGEEDEQSDTRIAKRVAELKKQQLSEQSDFMKKATEIRIAQLTNGFALLKVGSSSITDRQRLKDKCDDAVNAVRLALKGGVVKGAGLAFKEISDKMEEGDILKRPLLCVYNQIVSSAPEDFVIEDWVKDPMLILKTVLEKTCGFCATFASINAIAAEENKPKIDLASLNRNE
jgi:chaperonin GroEL